MKALSILEPNKAEILEVNKPVADGNMVVVKVERAGVCATDYSIFTGECSFVKDGSIKYPVRLGHEWAGVVEAVGPNVTKFKVGDRVVSDSGVSCGVCDTCKSGDFANCPNIKSVGTINTWDGCFAEYMLMPEYHLYKLTDEISMKEAALIEPTAIAYDAFTDAQVTEDSTVVVMGTGAIGMASAWLAHYLGAKQVIMVGRNDEKLNVAKQIGTDVVINNKNESVLDRVMELTNGKGADIVIETSGAGQLLIDSFYCARRYGRVSVLSFYERELNNIPMDHVVINCLTVRGAAGCYAYPQKVIEIMDKNPIDLSAIVTHEVAFKDCVEFFEEEQKYHNNKIKAEIVF